MLMVTLRNKHGGEVYRRDIRPAFNSLYIDARQFTFWNAIKTQNGGSENSDPSTSGSTAKS